MVPPLWPGYKPTYDCTVKTSSKLGSAPGVEEEGIRSRDVLRTYGINFYDTCKGAVVSRVLSLFFQSHAQNGSTIETSFEEASLSIPISPLSFEVDAHNGSSARSHYLD